MKKTDVILIGAGDRGTAYATLGKKACPELLNIVAVAEPDEVRRNFIKNLYSVPEENCFPGWQEALSREKFADAVIIATQDKAHYEPAMRAISAGYHVLLEKPAAPTPRECIDISRAAKEKNVTVVVCHVLRFTPFFSTLKKLISSGKIGEIINIVHVECVGNIHHSHSYVRGNWKKSADSSPMILAKSCHDLDILQWLIDSRCTDLQSFGSLRYFKRENAPENAPDFCIEGCPAEKDCPYSALKIYRDRGFEAFVKTATKRENPTDEEILRTITETDYGRCVFKCENDVVDHQLVNLRYENGATVSFTMSAFNEGGRKLRIMGTKGEIVAEMANHSIEIFDFLTRKRQKINIAGKFSCESISGGHGGGDRGIIMDFARLLCGIYDGNAISDISVSMENHLTAFAAEKSRLEGTVINIEDYIKGLE